jgi:hypothetical protein
MEQAQVAQAYVARRWGTVMVAAQTIACAPLNAVYWPIVREGYRLKQSSITDESQRVSYGDPGGGGGRK